MKEFTGKVAVITGASSGLGRALAGRCAQEGMKVVLADAEQAPLAQAEKDLRAAGAPVLAVVTDVSNSEDVEALVKKTLDGFGAVHLLCNTAAVHCPKPLAEATLADWKWVTGVNLYGAIHTLAFFVPVMLGQDTECHIVNTASVLGGFHALPFDGPYNVSQFGVVTLTETLYLELSQMYPKVKVSLLCPEYANAGILDSEQHRPAALRSDLAEGPAGEATPHLEEIKSFIRAAAQADTAPEQLAAMTFDAIREERFYIIPHPEAKIIMRDRLDRVNQQRNPENILSMMGIVS
jgi:NAD(P)-dependent dehydrogenase (short-subunit alcohol dehydrogenase family)